MFLINYNSSGPVIVFVTEGTKKKKLKIVTAITYGIL